MNINAIINRTKNLIISPIEEWKNIEKEETVASDVLKNFVLPYLVLNALASIVGNVLFTGKILFYNPVPYAIISAVISILIYLIVIYVTAEIIKRLGPNFDTEIDNNKAFKLVAYSFAPSYVISIIVGIFPFLYPLGILGLISFFVMWYGFGSLLHTPDEKKVGFFIISILIIIIEYLAIAFILGSILLGLIISLVMVK